MRTTARIARIQQETPTVKSFSLDLGTPDFDFLPGQWVDCYASLEGQPAVAGYSMTSSPLNKGAIELAVKRVGNNPVTRFLHEQAQVGDVFDVDGGYGEFFYTRDMGGPLVLIAGGIGITPLMSILRYVDEAALDVPVRLVYGATAAPELLFRDRLNELAGRNSRISCVFTVTHPPQGPWTGMVGRINGRLLGDLKHDRNSLFYVCGPPAMIDDVVASLETMDVPRSRIKYERW